MQRLTISVPIYDFKCIVIFDNKIEKTVDRYLKKDKARPLDEEVFGFSFRPGGSLKIYYIFYGLEKLDVNTICHEISHIIDFTLEDRNVEKSNGEARAYLTGYISEKVFDYIFKHKLLKNKWLKEKQEETSKPIVTEKLEISVSNQSSSSTTKSD